MSMPDERRGTKLVVSIVGWGNDEDIGQYWKVIKLVGRILGKTWILQDPNSRKPAWN